MSHNNPVTISLIKSDPLLSFVGITRVQVIQLTSAFVTSGRIAAAKAADAAPIVNERVPTNER